jgi:hypothetical protein
MASIALGEGVIGIAEIAQELKKVGFAGHTTLEVAGERAVLASRDFLLSQCSGARRVAEPASPHRKLHRFFQHSTYPLRLVCVSGVALIFNLHHVASRRRLAAAPLPS